MAFWILKCNPEGYRLEERLAGEIARLESEQPFLGGAGHRRGVALPKREMGRADGIFDVKPPAPR